MKNKKQLLATALTVGMILLFVSALMPLFSIHWEGLRYAYAAGAVLTLAVRIIDRYRGGNKSVARLYRIQTVSAACYCVSAVLLFFTAYQGANEQDWLAFLTAGAALQVYTSFRIQAVETKDRVRENKN